MALIDLLESLSFDFHTVLIVAWPQAVVCGPQQLLFLRSVPSEVLTASLLLLIFINFNFPPLFTYLSIFIHLLLPLFPEKIKVTLCLSVIVQGLFCML